MPLYEYECDNGDRFEIIQKFSDPPVEVCPKCGAKAHKMISSPAFQFKGTGWYVTDYAKKDSGGGKSADDSSESKEKKDTAAPETKKTESTSSTNSEKTSTKSSEKSST